MEVISTTNGDYEISYLSCRFHSKYNGNVTQDLLRHQEHAAPNYHTHFHLFKTESGDNKRGELVVSLKSNEIPQ